MIYYVGTYRTNNISERKPLGSDAEDVKIAYVVSAIKKIKQKVTTVSVLSSLKSGFNARKTCQIDDLETQIYLESLDSQGKIFSKFGVVQRLLSLFAFLLFHAGKQDTVLVYNTQLFSAPVRMAKKIKNFKLILEVEEVFYMDNTRPKDVSRKGLEKALIAAADEYIFASDLLAQRLAEGKKYAVVYGGYTTPPRTVQRRNDGNIHVVYAGGIDSLRRVDYAVKAFRFLPDGYRLHILGHGSESNIETLKKEIEQVNQAAGYEKTQYVGSLYGKDYDEYLESCHIGLNMQAIGSSIEDVAYPSKISSYLGRGLTVVSGRLSSIEASPFVNGMQLYDESSPEEIAKAILACNIRSYDEQVSLIHGAEKRFLKELDQLV